MMKRLNVLMIFFGLLLLAAGVSKASVRPCRGNPVTDADKRDFGDLKPLRFDVDGDNSADTFTPRVYSVKAAANRKGIRRENWIEFDLRTSRGKTIRSVFKFKYGTNVADYWVYALIPCRIGGDKAANDLLFYAGDDGGDETVILENRGTSFRVYLRRGKTF